jgi:predicted secreted protein
MRTLLAFLAIITVAFFGAARAGDAANLEYWGFSKDGKYLAFEQYGTQDGSGFAYAELYVVDVARNATVSAQNVVLQSGSPDQARKRTLAQSQTALKRYGIVRGNQGRFAGIAAQNPTADVPQRVEFNAVGRTRTLELSTRAAPETQTKCSDKPSRLLSLRFQPGGVLQSDAKLPASRRCAFDYEIQSVFVYGSSLAVLIKVSLYGFEGPDLRWMMVTARLR